MQSELMTQGSSDPAPLSAITIQAMAHLGYTADATQADVHTLPSSISGTGGMGARDDREGRSHLAASCSTPMPGSTNRSPSP